MTSSIIQALFLNQNSAQYKCVKKRNDKESMICLTPKTSEKNSEIIGVSLSTVYKARKFLYSKECFKETESLRLKKKRKEGFLSALAMGIKTDPTTTIRKYSNELKVYEKTVRTVSKQGLSPDLNPHDYAICGILENKTNATSYPISVCLRLPLRRNRIKCLKNLS